MSSPATVSLEHVLLPLLIQLMVIIGAARLGAIAFRRIGQPQVCGEIAAGLILGPSVFGGLFPGIFARVFDPSVAPVVSILSQLGLILLMFLIGLEFDFGHVRANRRAAVLISVSGMAAPFGLGLLVARAVHHVVAPGVAFWHFALFMGTALSITAIPILGRIMIELNIQRSRIGSLTITAAAIDDVAGWILLAVVTAIVRARFETSQFAWMIGETAAYALFMIVVARPLLRRWTQAAMRTGPGELSLKTFAVLLMLILGCAAITNKIGIFSVFGAFILGAVLHDQDEFREAVRRALRDFVVAFFLPIFFTYTGLRTDIGTMSGGVLWGTCGLVLFAAIAGKLGGCAAGARMAGFQWREAAVIGVMMNTRALMELVVVNIGFDLGVLPPSAFFILVFMAVVTTYMTVPILRRLMVGTELEPDFRTSQFVREGISPAPSHRPPR